MKFQFNATYDVGKVQRFNVAIKKKSLALPVVGRRKLIEKRMVHSTMIEGRIWLANKKSLYQS